MKQRLYYWWLASRPKTLPAAAVPVVIGGALAGAGDSFSLLPWSLCLCFALLIQIGTNFANDYFDFMKGADGEKRLGPARAVASGWIAPVVMLRMMYLAFAGAFIVGIGLIPFGGPWLVVVGILSILCGIAYTGGPYPLGYNGWGDVFVFVFFGWVATSFTYFVQAGSFVLVVPGYEGGALLWWAGVLPGALATNLLVVNNYRDAPEDARVGKRTLVVRWGRKAAFMQYHAMNGLALLVPLIFALKTSLHLTALTLGAAPFLWANSQLLRKEAYAAALGRTALALMGMGILFSGTLLF